MKIAFIFPPQPRCGIATYSRRYAEALAAKAEIVCFDPLRFTRDRDAFLLEINGCDIAHVQYEPSFFHHAGRDFFSAFCRRVSIPLVTTLHEVYRAFPGVYPREAITGCAPAGLLRRWLYDRRHPLQAAYRRHARCTFFSRAVLVHYDFQKAIVIDQGCRPASVLTLPHPVPHIPGAMPPAPWKNDRPLQLAATGFINPHFDYDLLFAALERLTLPWRFTWLGGARRDEDAPLLSAIAARIKEKNWNDRFLVTGWIAESELHARLLQADMVCAFFSNRSSSGSLTEALGALRPVIATPIALTEELARSNLIVLSAADPEKIARTVALLATSVELRPPLLATVANYCRDNSYSALADRLLNLYRAILRDKAEPDR